MSEWQEVKLGELVDIGSSKRIFYEDYVNAGIPFYRSKEVIQKHNSNDISTDLFITKEKLEQIKEKYGEKRLFKDIIFIPVAHIDAVLLEVFEN